MQIIAGVDEVGRGPLAGSVVAAAVILGPDHGIVGLADSKAISEKKRIKLAAEICQKAQSYAIAEACVEEIDEMNILQASLLAMRRAIEGLDISPTLALIDGNLCPKGLACPSEAIIKGDAKVAEISAASIIAKVYRDDMMLDLHEKHPEYGFASHKGYPTKAHREALIEFGVLSEHRRSFAPVRKILESTTT